MTWMHAGALRIALGAAIVAAAALAPRAAVAQTASAQPRVQAGVSLSHDTVTVGTPFVVSVRVRAPLGADITFPDGPDTTGTVQPLDSPVVGESADTAAADRTARYRLAAWDTGDQAVRIGTVHVVLPPPGGIREIRLDPVTVHVASVLPADSAEHEPKPARSLFEFGGPWWLPWLLGLLALAIIGVLLWWLWRRLRRPKPVPVVDPYQHAEARFAGIESLGLLEAGERGRYVALMLDVMREYLTRRFPHARASFTSRELLLALQRERAVPTDRLAVVLHEGDLIKFARRPITAERARELGAESRAIVHAIHTTPPPEAAVPPQPPAPRQRVGSAA